MQEHISLPEYKKVVQIPPDQRFIDEALSKLKFHVQTHNPAFANSDKWKRIYNAVHESLMNAITHGNPPIILYCCCLENHVTVMVEDSGKHDPQILEKLSIASTGCPNPEENLNFESGRGLRIMCSMSDSVKYEHSNGKKRFIMDFELKWRILVVDDSPNYSSNMFKTFLNKYFPQLSNVMEFIGAQNGKEAIELMKSPYNHIDLIVLDLIMPEMNGVEVCKWLKRENWLEHIPVIILTANVDQFDTLELFRMGCTKYYNKPVMFRSLHRMLIRTLKIDQAFDIDIYEDTL